MPKNKNKEDGAALPLFGEVIQTQIDAWIAEHGSINVFGCPSDGKKGCYLKPVTPAVLIETIRSVAMGDLVAQGTTVLASCWLAGDADLMPKNNLGKSVTLDYLSVAVAAADCIAYATTSTKKGILEVFPKKDKPFFGNVTAEQAQKWAKDHTETYTLSILDKDGNIKTGGYLKHPTPYIISKVQKDMAHFKLYDVGRFILVNCWLGGDGKLLNEVSIDSVSAALEVYQLGKLPTVQSWTL